MTQKCLEFFPVRSLAHVHEIERGVREELTQRQFRTERFDLGRQRSVKRIKVLELEIPVPNDVLCLLLKA